MNLQKIVREKGAFGKPTPESLTTWNRWQYAAEGERCVMVKEFHAWLVQARHETEKKLFHMEREMEGAAPFAQAGMNAAETPADLPLVVIEFAGHALEVMELKRKMALLDTYYEIAAYEICESHFEIRRGEEANFNALWALFLEDREETQTDALKLAA
jgi:hypothetical protein